MYRCTLWLVLSVTVTLASPLAADEPNWPALPYTPHSSYQAVDDLGNGVFPLGYPIRLRGLILNRSEAMLNPAAGAPAFLGGQWQIYVQAADVGDFGGTACYMAEKYGNLPWVPDTESYTAQEWLDELARLTHDPETGRAFRPGDLVEIRARVPGLHYGGKTNVNEAHSKNPANDFDVVLLAADCGLPSPTLITLADVKDAANEFIFDATRQTGGERYQASLVRINQVWFVNPSLWAPNATLEITDGSGRTLPLKLGLGSGYTAYPPPTGPFDVVAIFDQEDANSDGDGMEGYRLWLHQDYNGNGLILPRPPTTPGDLNADGAVDLLDVPLFVQALLDDVAFEAACPECDLAAANCDGQCGIDGRDVAAFTALLLD